MLQVMSARIPRSNLVEWCGTSLSVFAGVHLLCGADVGDNQLEAHGNADALLSSRCKGLLAYARAGCLTV